MAGLSAECAEVARCCSERCVVRENCAFAQLCCGTPERDYAEDEEVSGRLGCDWYQPLADDDD